MNKEYFYLAFWHPEEDSVTKNPKKDLISEDPDKDPVIDDPESLRT